MRTFACRLLSLSVMSHAPIRAPAADQAFRWSDMPAIGNEDDVYDIAPPLYEPVEQFGGNRFLARWLPD